jgi:hypothetical protein
VLRPSHLLAGIALFACVSTAWAQEISVRAGLETEDALLGDEIGFHVIVEGADRAEGPELEDFGHDVDVRFLGGRPERRSSTVWVNGRRVDSDEVRYTLVYSVRPRRAGTLTIPELTVKAGDREFTTPERTLRVIGPRASDRATLKLSFAPPRVYVEQPVDFVLELAVQRAQLPDEWYDGDPWFSGRPPELRVPWFEELDGFLTGEPRGFMRSLLATGNQSGLRVNGIASQGILGDARALRFKLPRGSEVRDSRGVFVYSLRKRFVPIRAGKHEIPVSTLTGDLVQTLTRARGQLEAGETETVFIAHEPVALEVLPVPAANRPPTYTHAVGTFAVDAAVSPTRVKVGDPMDVTLTVTGTGLLDRVEPPDFAQQPGLADLFQVGEGDPPRTTDEGRVFSFLFRPKKAGITEIPALELASFDPVAERFVTAHTAPLRVTVEDAQAVLPSDVVIAGGATPATTSPGEEVEGGLLGNYSSDEAIVDETFAPQDSLFLWLLLVLPPGLFAGALFVAHRRALHERDPLLQRARTAGPRALAAICDAVEAHGAGDDHAAAGLLHGALTTFVADRARRPAGGMTAADVESVLRSAGVDAALLRPVVDALRAAEQSRFGGTAGDLAAQLDAAPAWVRALERERLS